MQPNWAQHHGSPLTRETENLSMHSVAHFFIFESFKSHIGVKFLKSINGGVENQGFIHKKQMQLNWTHHSHGLIQATTYIQNSYMNSFVEM